MAVGHDPHKGHVFSQAPAGMAQPFEPLSIGCASGRLPDYLQLEFADVAFKALHHSTGINADGRVLEDRAGQFADNGGRTFAGGRHSGYSAAPPKRAFLHQAHRRSLPASSRAVLSPATPPPMTAARRLPPP